LYRAAHSFKDLTAVVDNEPTRTGAVFGLLKQLIRLHHSHGGEIVLAWDSQTNFRYGLFPKYKHHPDMGDDKRELMSEVHIQEPLALRLCSYLGIRQAGAEGYEADDVMHSLAVHFSESGHNVFIYTGDKDLLQSIGPNRSIALAKHKGPDIIMDEAQLLKDFGMTPAQFGDAKCLSGCNSDKVPGVPGIGETYSARIIQHFGRLGDVYHNLNKPERWEGLKVPDKLRKAILDNWEQVKLNVKLIRLADCRATTEFIPIVRDIELAKELLVKLNFKSFIIPNKFEKLLALGVPKSNEFICPRGNTRYSAKQLTEMCTYYLKQDVSPTLANEHCHMVCDIPAKLGLK
jgi:DNA polymerase-1